MKFGVKRFKIYFNAQNLLTFSNCSFIDPESSEFGSNMNSGAPTQAATTRTCVTSAPV